MTKSPKKQPPQDLDTWHDNVLGEVEIKAIPIEYIKEINIVFSSGEVTTIDVKSKRLAADFEEIEDLLEELIDDYEDEIDGIDFSLNTAKVQKDMTKLTKRFLKKKK
jgi:hypothetical protein